MSNWLSSKMDVYSRLSIGLFTISLCGSGSVDITTDLDLSVEPQAFNNMLAPIKRTKYVLRPVNTVIKFPDVIL
jgi:hypothetical protein